MDRFLSYCECVFLCVCIFPLCGGKKNKVKIILE